LDEGIDPQRIPSAGIIDPQQHAVTVQRDPRAEPPAGGVHDVELAP